MITDADRRRVRAAKSRADAADRRLLELVGGLFPVGARIRWAHGDGVRSGMVMGISGHRSDTLRLSVETPSGRTCWIHAWRVLSFAGV